MADEVAERVRVFAEQRREGEGLSRRVVASWQRSEDYGVSLERVAPVFTGTGDVDSLFHQCGTEVLADLFSSLATEPVSLMLTDPDGVVLSRLSGDRSLLDSLDRVHLAPGFAFAERDVGTNGLGLALADRVPTLLCADQHYSLDLRRFTCAAVPVLDPVTNRLEGSVNLTTWSDSSSALLLALARSAAGNTAALMAARGGGKLHRPTPRGQVFRVEVPRLEPGSGTLHNLGAEWNSAVARAESGMAAGGIVAAVGENGSGRATALAQAARHLYPRDRILSATTPAPPDVQTWLGLWGPELGKENTAVIVRGVDALPQWAADRLRGLLAGGGNPVPFAITAESFDAIPAVLRGLVTTVVPVPPLRDRTGDITALAEHIAKRVRNRDIAISPAAARALRNYDWPGNIDELTRVITDVVSRADSVAVSALPPHVLGGSTRHLSRIEILERGEIVRVLADHEGTMSEAAAKLGMSRATLFRKLSQYGISQR